MNLNVGGGSGGSVSKSKTNTEKLDTNALISKTISIVSNFESGETGERLRNAVEAKTTMEEKSNPNIEIFDRNGEQQGVKTNDKEKGKNYGVGVAYIKYKVQEPMAIKYIAKEGKEYTNISAQSIVVLETGQIIIQLKIESKKGTSTTFALNCKNEEELNRIMSKKSLKIPEFDLTFREEDRPSPLGMEGRLSLEQGRMQKVFANSLERNQRIIGLINPNSLENNPLKLVRPETLNNFQIFSQNLDENTNPESKVKQYAILLKTFEEFVLTVIQRLKGDDFLTGLDRYLGGFWKSKNLDKIKSENIKSWLFYTLINILNQSSNGINPVLKIRALKVLTKLNKKSLIDLAKTENGIDKSHISTVNTGLLTGQEIEKYKNSEGKFTRVTNKTGGRKNLNFITECIVKDEKGNINTTQSAINFIKYKIQGDKPNTHIMEIAILFLHDNEYSKVGMEIFKLLGAENYTSIACLSVGIKPLGYKEKPNAITIDASKTNRNVLQKTELIENLMRAENEKLAQQSEILMLRERLDAIKKDYEAKIKALSDELETLKAKQPTSASAKPSATETILAKNIKSLQDQIATLKTQNAELQNNGRPQDIREIKRLKELKSTTPNEEIAKLKEDLNSTAKILAEANKTLTAVNKDLAAARAKINDLETENETLAVENKSLLKKLTEKGEGFLSLILGKKPTTVKLEKAQWEKAFDTLGMNDVLVARFERASINTQIAGMKRLLSMHKTLLDEKGRTNEFTKILAAANVIADKYKLPRFVSEDQNPEIKAQNELDKAFEILDIKGVVKDLFSSNKIGNNLRKQFLHKKRASSLVFLHSDNLKINISKENLERMEEERIKIEDAVNTIETHYRMVA